VDPLEPKAIEAAVAEFQQKLDRLKMLYEQYFMGIEKREPLVPLKDAVRIMRLLDGQQIRNTGLRYRFRNLVQKYNVYRTYWRRTLRAIEAGTYHRDIARISRQAKREGIEMPKLGTLKTAGDVERALADVAKARNTKDKKSRRPPSELRGKPAEALRDLGSLDDLASLQGGQPPDVPDEDTQPNASSPHYQPGQTELPPVTPSQPSAQAAAARAAGQRAAGRLPSAGAPPRQGGGASLPEDQMKSIYRRLIKAKRICGEDTESVRYESLVKTIDRQLPKLRQMHSGKDVDFQVVIRGGRAILKAKPKD